MWQIETKLALNDVLNDIDLTYYDKYLIDSVKGQFYNTCGNEHYRLLNYLCDGKQSVLDVGTYRGVSAIAMSSAKQVVSWDVENLLKCNLPENVTNKVGDILSNYQDISDWKFEIILLDTYHTGEFESEFYQRLIDIGYKGLLILDDIHLNSQMENFWESIYHKKEDWTHVGHYSGTGLVWFENEKSSDNSRE